MGAVIGPEDILKGRKWILKRAIKDLGPEQAERVEKILRRWDEKSESELIELLGERKAKRLLVELGVRN